MATPNRNLDEWLEAVAVHDPAQWENDDGPTNWFAVSADDEGGIFAYFRDEDEAFRFRLAYINRKLNG